MYLVLKMKFELYLDYICWQIGNFVYRIKFYFNETEYTDGNVLFSISRKVWRKKRPTSIISQFERNVFFQYRDVFMSLICGCFGYEVGLKRCWSVSCMSLYHSFNPGWMECSHAGPCRGRIYLRNELKTHRWFSGGVTLCLCKTIPPHRTHI